MVPRNTHNIGSISPAIRHRLVCSIAVIILGVGSLPVLGAENRTQPQAELTAVTAAIADIQSWLNNATAQYTADEQALREAELRLAASSNDFTQIEAALNTSREQQRAITDQITQLEAARERQHALLAQLLRAAYIGGDQSPLKLLLSQEDPAKSARMLHYYQVYTASQVSALQTYQDTLSAIGTAEAELAANARTLLAQQTELQQQIAVLESSQQAKQLALANLQASIARRNAELEQLEMDQAQLQQLVDEIQRAVERVPTPVVSTTFSARRGLLEPPVSGPILRDFGTQYGDGNLRRQGISIATAEGTPVRAVHPGRVVFANWLRGTGLLLVLDHGDGFMSLYGNNQALAKAAGDWVESGEVVATSGQSADSQDTALYFEIRQHGTPQNPMEWLQRTN